jgi:adenylate kinase family enzyme
VILGSKSTGVFVLMNPHPGFRLPGPRIIVIGSTGSGKSTLSERLSHLLAIPHVEMDALHWQENWTMTDLASFREKVALALSGSAWVVDGNYAKVRDLVWPRANTLVWLDYSLPLILWQLTWRTFARVFTRVELWNGNRETFRGAFFSRDSLFLWALQTHRRHRVDFNHQLSLPENAHLQVVHLHNRAETSRWIADIEDYARLEADVTPTSSPPK